MTTAIIYMRLTVHFAPKRHSQPLNLRKLGVGYNGREFRLASFLRLPARIPLLEGFEFHTLGEAPSVFDSVYARTPVMLKHLQFLVFRGVRPDFPHRTRIILTYYLYDTLRFQ